ncbi:MAG: hypothetical protein HY351_02210 [Candidatus Omnitrophica bacterium]|nr:hypothetical protein [Candidatus Omnitrophota bacterium]
MQYVKIYDGDPNIVCITTPCPTGKLVKEISFKYLVNDGGWPPLPMRDRITAHITYHDSEKGGVAKRDVEMLKMEDGQYHIQSVVDMNADRKVIAKSEFHYLVAIAGVICPEGEKCTTPPAYVHLGDIIRTDANGNLLSTITDIGEGYRIQTMIYPPVPPAFFATVVLPEGIKREVMFKTLEELLAKTLKIERRPRIIHKMPFGDNGRVIIERRVDQDGKVHLIVKAQVLVFPVGLKPAYRTLAEFEVKDFKAIAGISNQWYKQTGLVIYTVDGKTITFRSIHYARNNSTYAYYTVEELVKSEMYGELKRTLTVRLVNGVLQKTSEMLMARTSPVINGSTTGVGYWNVVQNRYWSYDASGKIVLEAIHRRTDNGSSIYMASAYDSSGAVKHFVQVYEPGKGIVFKKEFALAAEIKRGTETSSGLWTSVSINMIEYFPNIPPEYFLIYIEIRREGIVIHYPGEEPKVMPPPEGVIVWN